jgi:hypothetical protein
VLPVYGNPLALLGIREFLQDVTTHKLAVIRRLTIPMDKNGMWIDRDHIAIPRGDGHLPDSITSLKHQ